MTHTFLLFFILLEAVAPPPPTEFYYFVSALFGAFIIWGLGYYIVSTHNFMKKLSDSQVSTNQIIKIHEEWHKQHTIKIEEHDDDIDEIKSHIYNRKHGR